VTWEQLCAKYGLRIWKAHGRYGITSIPEPPIHILYDNREAVCNKAIGPNVTDKVGNATLLIERLKRHTYYRLCVNCNRWVNNQGVTLDKP